MKKANVERERPESDRKRLKEITAILSKHDIAHGMTPSKLVAILVDLGSTFVKIGQLLSMRSDLLPPEYCNALATLRTNINPLVYDEIKGIIEKEYAKEIDTVFSYFERSPIGAASIAQVHRACVGDKDVVVKVQRPDLYETMSSDILLMKKAVKIIDKTGLIGKEIDLDKVLDEMWTVTKRELDFSCEAEHLKIFRENNEEIRYVTCPKVHEELSTHKILVMEYAGGIYIDELDKLKESGYDTEEIAQKLANNYVKQVIEDGFFHADPHAGNIKVDAGRIMWLDLGMMGRLNEWEKTHLGEIVKGFDDNNTSRVTDAVLNLGTPLGDIDIAALNADIEGLIAKHAMGDVSSIDIKVATEDIFEAIRRNKIAFPESLSMLGRGMSTIQGVMKMLECDISFAQILTGYVTNDFMKKLHIDKELKQMVKGSYYSIKKFLSLPSQISDSLKMLEKGLTKVKLELGLSNQMKSDLDSMVNKMVMGTIAAALLIGSSLICTTNMSPKMLNIPALGFIGYVGALALMIKLLFFDKKKK